MADLAMLFHWPLRDMEAMGVAELMQWRTRAVQLHNRMNEAPE